ncbi:MAG: DUF3090 family protein [bacterium]|nr:DUF3090 family protein [bacterium]
MPNIEIELNPVDFITIGTVGPKGQRIFHLQAGKEDEIVTLTIEKEQAHALSEAIKDLLDDLDKRFPEKGSPVQPVPSVSMDLRDPIEPKFRVAQMGLGYDEERDMIVLVAQELVASLRAAALDDDEDDEDDERDPFGLETDSGDEPGIVRMWCSREQMRGLSQHSMDTVQSGRPDPKLNGRLVYYWT